MQSRIPAIDEPPPGPHSGRCSRGNRQSGQRYQTSSAEVLTFTELRDSVAGIIICLQESNYKLVFTSQKALTIVPAAEQSNT